MSRLFLVSVPFVLAEAVTFFVDYPLWLFVLLQIVLAVFICLFWWKMTEGVRNE